MIEDSSYRYGVRTGLAALCALLTGAVWAGDNAPEEPTHLGVATCASSTCHGRVSADERADMALNEYFVWSKYDRHSEAYKTLEGDWSRRIADNMGLGDPTKAEECLVCHSDYVPQERRGERFHLSDGVGCEACHGGAEAWIDSHYGPDATHAANLDEGMRPTEEPVFQARKCQSCHVGDEDRLASHEMMAAGHPRLRFELDNWLANMPPHHVEDEDYRERKGAIAATDRWAAGVAVAASRYLDTLSAHLDTGALMPEPALFDCHSCHRSMDTQIRRLAVDKRLVPAGTLRPNDHGLRMLATLVGLRDETIADRIEDGNRALHRAAAGSADAFVTRARELRDAVADARRMVTAQFLARDERNELERALLRDAAAVHFRDYADAEQLYLALQALAADAPDTDPARYDELFRLLDNERAFDPRRVAAEARRLLGKDARQ